MEKHEIIFEISRSGEIQATVKGMKGNGCEELAEELAKLGKLKSKKKTSEYFEAKNAAVRTTARGQR